MHKSIQEAMTPNPTAIEPTTAAREAARILKAENVGALPIIEDGKLVGMVTDRDLAIRVLAEGKDADTPVGEIASKDVVTGDPQQTLEEAARLMASTRSAAYRSSRRTAGWWASSPRQTSPRPGTTRSLARSSSRFRNNEGQRFRRSPRLPIHRLG